MVGFWQRLCRVVQRDHGQVLASQRNGTPDAAPGRGQTVLIVDLDGQSGQLLADSLGAAGFAPCVARRDNAALELLGHVVPAAVLVSGPVNACFYRAVRGAVPVPILALAPRASDEQVMEAFVSGVDQFQSGPIGPAEVVAQVVALLRRAP